MPHRRLLAQGGLLILFVLGYNWLQPLIQWVIIGNLEFEAYFEVLYPFL